MARGQWVWAVGAEQGKVKMDGIVVARDVMLG